MANEKTRESDEMAIICQANECIERIPKREQINEAGLHTY